MIGLGSAQIQVAVKADYAARSIIGTQKDVAIWLRSNRSIGLQKKQDRSGPAFSTSIYDPRFASRRLT